MPHSPMAPPQATSTETEESTEPTLDNYLGCGESARINSQFSRASAKAAPFKALFEALEFEQVRRGNR